MKSLGFDSEEQLVGAIVACARRARRRDYRVEQQLDAGVGIADVVMAKRAPRSTQALKALASVSPRLAVLLSSEVASSVRSSASLAASLGSSEAAARRVVGQLAASGLASGTSRNFALSTVSVLPFERVIAVEAKLSEWQRVLVQAYRNLQFANESWVVLDHAYIRPALAQVERFRSTGVGLASVARDQMGLFIHLPAASAGPMSATKRWQAQAVLAARAMARRASSERT